jgi:hypothetical protein
VRVNKLLRPGNGPDTVDNIVAEGKVPFAIDGFFSVFHATNRSSSLSELTSSCQFKFNGIRSEVFLSLIAPGLVGNTGEDGLMIFSTLNSFIVLRAWPVLKGGAGDKHATLDCSGLATEMSSATGGPALTFVAHSAEVDKRFSQPSTSRPRRPKVGLIVSGLRRIEFELDVCDGSLGPGIDLDSSNRSGLGCIDLESSCKLAPPPIKDGSSMLIPKSLVSLLVVSVSSLIKDG